jgi:hypothetical protein
VTTSHGVQLKFLRFTDFPGVRWSAQSWYIPVPYGWHKTRISANLPGVIRFQVKNSEPAEGQS